MARVRNVGRVLLGFLAPALILAMVIYLLGPHAGVMSISSAAAIMGFIFFATLLTGGPILFFLKSRGWLQLWRLLVVGFFSSSMLVCGLAFFIDIQPNAHFMNFGLYLFLGMYAGIVALVYVSLFWIIAIRRNPLLQAPPES